MAQRTSEPLSSVASEGISASVPPSLTLTSIVPPSAQASHPLVREMPLFSIGHWKTFASPESVTESVSVIATHAPETLLTTFPSQGYAASDTHPAAAASVIGSLPFGEFISLPPLVSSPLPILPFGLPTDGTPTMQAQHLMDLVQTLQGMALLIHPSMVPATPEVSQ